MDKYFISFGFWFVILTISLLGLRKIKKKAEIDWGSYCHAVFLFRAARIFSILGLITVLLFFIIDYKFGTFDFVYAQTTGYYISNNYEVDEIDMINFIDNKVLEITNDGSSSKAIYEKVDPTHFKFKIGHNGETVEYIGEVIEEIGNYQIILLGADQSINLIKSPGV